MARTVVQLDKITLPPAPIRDTDAKRYQQNVENWARQVERTIRILEAKIRDLVNFDNGN